MGVNHGWRALLGQTLVSVQRETVNVVGKSVCWELFGTLHRLIRGHDAAQVGSNYTSTGRNTSGGARYAHGATSPAAERVLKLAVNDTLLAAEALVHSLQVKHVHVVLEGMHPAKTTTQMKRRKRAGVRPTDELVNTLATLFVQRFPGRVTIHHPPHDADSQLAYLCAAGLADYALVPSNDSDMALFHGMENKLIVSPSWSTESTGIEGVVYRGTKGHLEGFSVDMLRCFAAIVGCDFFKCKTFGLMRAAHLVRTEWRADLTPQDNCARIQEVMGSAFEPSDAWQVNTLSEAYSCFSCQLVRTPSDDILTVDEASGIAASMLPTPAPALAASRAVHLQQLAADAEAMAHYADCADSGGGQHQQRVQSIRHIGDGALSERVQGDAMGTTVGAMRQTRGGLMFDGRTREARLAASFAGMANTAADVEDTMHGTRAHGATATNKSTSLSSSSSSSSASSSTARAATGVGTAAGRMRSVMEEERFMMEAFADEDIHAALNDDDIDAEEWNTDDDDDNDDYGYDADIDTNDAVGGNGRPRGRGGAVVGGDGDGDGDADGDDDDHGQEEDLATAFASMTVNGSADGSDCAVSGSDAATRASTGQQRQRRIRHGTAAMDVLLERHMRVMRSK
ncbi:hypothetical protein PTSG_02621 [Salpingoeca rosetta]|uniref:Exonuclease 1 n=1 Tax=Salpingoeca rosetta (strain ATCC 50818 / BSB-021) TaxID=946362 RepID=F2U2U1_SALR5|nr:uncharacterized protein PTSG_02621 [Salpingoeca rosetta]EGD81935.1 hypothetical protein PTSG_02621 [Salpingoeca rosetta]|eukprot:XP_004996118.1 hypothetical protein PTSG_02621 [Salpingoeca rosetta]